MLVRLLYASRASVAVTHEIIEAILQSSRRHNPELGITGVLCHGGDVYLQVLECGRTAVNAMYSRIVRDERHHDVMLLYYVEVSERHFAGWTMGQVNLAKVNPSTLLKYSDRPVRLRTGGGRRGSLGRRGRGEKQDRKPRQQVNGFHGISFSQKNLVWFSTPRPGARSAAFAAAAPDGIFVTMR